MAMTKGTVTIDGDGVPSGSGAAREMFDAYDATLVQQLFTGTHTGANGATVLEDTGQSFTVDELVGKFISNTTDGSLGNATENTSTTVNVVLASGTNNFWNNGDSYSVDTLAGAAMVATRNSTADLCNSIAEMITHITDNADVTIKTTDSALQRDPSSTDDTLGPDSNKTLSGAVS